jgi:hypothetical protein
MIDAWIPFFWFLFMVAPTSVFPPSYGLGVSRTTIPMLPAAYPKRSSEVGNAPQAYASGERGERKTAACRVRHNIIIANQQP